MILAACRESKRKRQAKYRARNRIVLRERNANYYAMHRDAMRESHAKYWAENPAKRCALQRKCNISRLRRIPAWLTTEDYSAIEEVYSQAIRLTKKTGVKHVVDHIYPLQGVTVSGLHVRGNLWVIPAAANSKKRNRDPQDYLLS